MGSSALSVIGLSASVRRWLAGPSSLVTRFGLRPRRSRHSQPLRQDGRRFTQSAPEPPGWTSREIPHQEGLCRRWLACAGLGAGPSPRREGGARVRAPNQGHPTSPPAVQRQGAKARPRSLTGRAPEPQGAFAGKQGDVLTVDPAIGQAQLSPSARRCRRTLRQRRCRRPARSGGRPGLRPPRPPC